ncbi:MAG: hypothetical protein OXG68_08940 [Chloroflexi bacterium]|nr:hypothetical protein [Chloroflexota bacterium]
MTYKRKMHDTQPIDAQPGKKWSVWSKPETRRQRVRQLFVRAVFCYGLFGLLLAAAGVGNFVINRRLYQDTVPSPGCTLSHKEYRGEDFGVDVAIHGQRNHSAVVDVFREEEIQPLEVWMSGVKVFVGSDVPYIHQQYSSSLDLHPGMYRAEATLDGKTNTKSFHFTSGRNLIYARCN